MPEQFALSHVHAEPTHPVRFAFAIKDYPSARGHVPDRSVRINDSESHIEITFILGRLPQNLTKIVSIIGMNDAHRRFHRSIELLLRTMEQRIHKIVPGNAIGYQVPIP